VWAPRRPKVVTGHPGLRDAAPQGGHRAAGYGRCGVPRWAPGTRACAMRHPKVGAGHPGVGDAASQGGHRAPGYGRCGTPRWAPGSRACGLRRPIVVTGQPDLRDAAPHRGHRAPGQVGCDLPSWAPGPAVCGRARTRPGARGGGAVGAADRAGRAATPQRSEEARRGAPAKPEGHRTRRPPAPRPRARPAGRSLARSRSLADPVETGHCGEAFVGCARRLGAALGTGIDGASGGSA
jgi:hypothetical protein